MSEEATINPDGTQEMPPMNANTNYEQQEIPPFEQPEEETMQDILAAKGIDPAIYRLIAAFLVAAFVIYRSYANRKKASGDDFFAALDGDKVRYEMLLLRFPSCTHCIAGE